MDITLPSDSKDWLATGFFTPNYRSLAEGFAVQLRAHGIPHHLFAVEKSGEWAYETMRKPSIVLAAMDAHPGKTLVLMDVDCHINGPLDALMALNQSIDVSCFFYVKTKKIGRHRQRVSLSSRVVVVRPTPAARSFMINWREACKERPWMHGDEPNMMLALARSTGTSFSPIDLRFSGREVSSAPEHAVITHESASHQGKQSRPMLKRLWQIVGGSQPVDVAKRDDTGNARTEREGS